MIKTLILIFISFISLSIFATEEEDLGCRAQGYVQDFACTRSGWDDPTEPLGSTFAGIYAHFTSEDDICSENDLADLEAISCNDRGYTFPGLTRESATGRSAGDLRNMSEELIFLEAARRNHNFSRCQAQLYESLDEDPEMQEDFVRVAFDQFNEVQEQLARSGDIEAEMTRVAEQREQRARALLQERGRNRERQLAETEARNARYVAEQAGLKLRELMSRLPLGNRPEMKDSMVELARQRGSLTYDAFRTAYLQTTETLQAQANRSLATMEEIYVEGRKPNGDVLQLYRVDADFKRQIAATDQLQNVIDDLGLTDTLEDGFMCRIRQRYVRGPIAFEVAQIPLYFTGYGIARLGARVALSAASRIATAGRVINIGARAALIGLEAVDVATTAEMVRRCVNQRTYLQGTADGDCNPAEEVFTAFNEASMGQCATEAAIAGVSLGVPAVNALVRSPALRARLGLRGAPEAAPGNIVVDAAGAGGPVDRYVGDRYDEILADLRSDGDFTGLVVRPDRSAGLSRRERAVVFEYINNGNELTRDQARRLDELADRRPRTAQEIRDRDLELENLIRETGAPADQIAEIAEQVVESNLLGVRVAPTTGTNRAVAGVVTPPGSGRVNVPQAANNNLGGTLLSRDNLDELLSSLPVRDRNGNLTGDFLDFSRQTRNEIYDKLAGISPQNRQALSELLANNPERQSQYLMMVLNSSDAPATIARLGRLTDGNQATIIRELDDLIAAADDPIIRSQLMQERFIIQNGDRIEVSRIFSARAHNASIDGHGHSLDGSFGMDIRIKDAPDGDRLMLCRGSYGTRGNALASSQLAGGFLTLCRESDYIDRGEQIEFLAAPYDTDALFPGYDRFSRFEARPGEEFSFGLNGDVRYSNGSGGAGGGVEVFTNRTRGSVDAQADLRASVRTPVCNRGDANCASLFTAQANIRAGDLVNENASTVRAALDAAQEQADRVARADFNATELQTALRNNPDPTEAINDYLKNRPELTSALNLRQEIALKRDVNFSAGDSLDLETRNLQRYTQAADASAVDAGRIGNAATSQADFNRRAQAYMDNHSLVAQYRQRQAQINGLVGQLRSATPDTDQLDLLQQISNLRGQQSDLLIGIRGVESQMKYAPTYGRGMTDQERTDMVLRAIGVN